MGLGPRTIPGRGPATPQSRGSVPQVPAPGSRLPSINIPGNILNQPGRAAAGAGILYGASKLSEVPIRDRFANQFQDVLTFPKDLDKQHFMSLRFVKYVKRNINDRKTIEDKKFIALPLPDNLVDNISMEYDQKALGPVLGGFSEFLTGAGGGVMADAAAAAALQGAADYAGRLNIGGQNVLGSGSNVLTAASAISGVAINPFLTVAFKNPKFKQHSFTWKLIPRNKEESEEIRKIILAIKYHMSPGLLTRSGVFFTYPEMVFVKLHPNDDYTYKFKPCVVESFDVNYAPAGAPSFYWYNGAPTAIVIKMSLKEIEYFTKLDYLDQPFIDQMSGNVLSAALTGIAGAPPTLFTDALTSLPQFNILRNLPFGLNPLGRITGNQ